MSNNVAIPAIVDVIIIGAGASGISAAKTLLQKNENKPLLSVAVLEARNRVGGRCRTIQLQRCTNKANCEQEQQHGSTLATNKSIAIDMGASYAHTTKVQLATAATSFLQWSKEANIDLHLVPFDEDNLTFDFQTNQQLSDEFANLVEDTFEKLIIAFSTITSNNQLFNSEHSNSDCSLHDTVQYLLDNDSGLKQPLQQIEEKLGSSFVARMKCGWLRTLSAMLGIDAKNASFKWASCEEANQFSEGENDENFIVGLGYQNALQIMSQNLPIYFNTVVTCVEQQQQGALTNMLVHVKGQHQPIQCKHVICTLPLGVLKNGDVQFKPALPLIKQQAIQQLSNGLLNKTVLHFDHAFWPNNAESITFIPSEANDDLSTYCINMQKVANEPILVFFSEGPFAEALETMDDETIKQNMLSKLSKLFGEKTVAEAVLVHFEVTRWKSDPLTRGSYSAISVNTPMTIIDDLANVDSNDRLYFAGEHTILKNGGFVQGAIDSGVRAAQQVLQNNSH